MTTFKAIIAIVASVLVVAHGLQDIQCSQQGLSLSPEPETESAGCEAPTTVSEDFAFDFDFSDKSTTQVPAILVKVALDESATPCAPTTPETKEITVKEPVISLIVSNLTPLVLTTQKVNNSYLITPCEILSKLNSIEAEKIEEVFINVSSEVSGVEGTIKMNYNVDFSMFNVDSDMFEKDGYFSRTTEAMAIAAYTVSSPDHYVHACTMGEEDVCTNVDGGIRFIYEEAAENKFRTCAATKEDAVKTHTGVIFVGASAHVSLISKDTIVSEFPPAGENDYECKETTTSTVDPENTTDETTTTTGSATAVNVFIASLIACFSASH